MDFMYLTILREKSVSHGKIKCSFSYMMDWGSLGLNIEERQTYLFVQKLNKKVLKICIKSYWVFVQKTEIKLIIQFRIFT